jgi:hypothetical protein
VADEREVLADLVNGPGWTWFKDYVNSEWGPAGTRFHHAVADAAANKQGAVEALNMILNVQKEINALVAAPRRRYEQLDHALKAAVMPQTSSRRGPGL